MLLEIHLCHGHPTEKNHRITVLTLMEKTFEINESNLTPNTFQLTKPWHQMPHLASF